MACGSLGTAAQSRSLGADGGHGRQCPRSRALAPRDPDSGVSHTGAAESRCLRRLFTSLTRAPHLYLQRELLR